MQHTDAFPASTVPFFLNTVGSFDNISTVVSGFGCSSVSITTSPRAKQMNNYWTTHRQTGRQ